MLVSELGYTYGRYAKRSPVWIAPEDYVPDQSDPDDFYATMSVEARRDDILQCLQHSILNYQGVVI